MKKNRSTLIAFLLNWLTRKKPIVHRTERTAFSRIATERVKSFAHSMNITLQNDWNTLESMIDQDQDLFCKKLRDDYPTLTEKDRHIIFLIRTDMDHAEIAYRMNIQIDSFRKSRCRLKKKMGGTKEPFTAFIKALYIH